MKRHDFRLDSQARVGEDAREMCPLSSHPSDVPTTKLPSVLLLALAWAMLALPSPAGAQEPSAVALPPGVKAVWDADRAFHETTPTRERLCINGLWRWQPAADNAPQPPTAAWGYYKVPACWPGNQDYMQSDYQTLYRDPSWRNTNLKRGPERLVRTHDHHPQRLGGPAHCAGCGVSEFLRGSLC